MSLAQTLANYPLNEEHCAAIVVMPAPTGGQTLDKSLLLLPTEVDPLEDMAHTITLEDE